MSKTTFSVIVATDQDNGIGKDNKIPWKLKQDFKYFQTITKSPSEIESKSNKPNLMVSGRLTMLSIGKPLQGRLHCVLTKSKNPEKDGLEIGKYYLCGDFEDMLDFIDNADINQIFGDVYIIGGSSVYEKALASERCTKIYKTRIESKFDCDVFFPSIDDRVYQKITPDVDFNKPGDYLEENGIKYCFEVYERRSP